jgi:hypothetical protein
MAINYLALWVGSMAIGLLALANYPAYELAGAVLAGYVFVASTAMLALIHLISPK